jgi:uncharacterized protein DUF6600/FecR-like protein
MTRLPLFALCLATVCLWGSPSHAQENAANQPPAHISVVDGTAILERDGRRDTELMSMPVLSGDRLRTQAGRVEVLFADGSALHLDDNTVVDFQSDEVVRLLEGRVRLNVAGPVRDLSYRIDAPSAWVQISTPGEYRVAVLRDEEVELAVLRGSAELVNEQGRSYISAGERTFARVGSAPSPAYVFNSAAWDAFDRWSEARRDQRLGASAQYLPDDVRRYAPAFDTYGNWQYEQTYGYVWYPRVQVGWRPYHHGRWVSLRPYGWTWIAGDPWGWPTHHYGRWGYSHAGWYWIPGRTWGPAWVSWAYAPGYVSWCPLGWNNRAVFAFNFNSYYGGHRYDPWRAWTVVPRHHFNTSYINVSRYAGVRVDPRVHSQFVVGSQAPAAHYAVNRSSIPIRTVGRYPSFGSAPGIDGARAVVRGGAATAGSGQGFPTAARTPGTPLNPQADGSASVIRGGGMRAVPREAGARQPSLNVPSSSPVVIPENTSRGTRAGAGSITPGYREDGGARVRSSDQPMSAVTPGPSGAVRAVPRVRGAEPTAESHPPPTYERQDRVRSMPSAPSYQPPAAAAPSNPPAGYRTPSAERQYRAPEASAPAGDRGAGRSRGDAPGGNPGASGDGQPAYRSGPERQAPGGGAVERAPRGGDAPRPERGNPGAGGGARERSSEGRSTGQARSRR